LFIGLSTVVGVPAEVLAAPFYWDADGSASGNDTSGTDLGGSGIWDTSSALWWDGVSITNDNVWNNAGLDTAIFTGTPGTVTLGAPIVAGSLEFDTSDDGIVDPSGYGLTLGGESPTITVAADAAASIAASIHGTGSLAINGGGMLTLTSASNDYSGGTDLQSGYLSVWNDANLGATTGTVTFDGGTLLAGTFNTGRDIVINNSGGTFDVARTFITLLPGDISGTGTLNKTGFGELRLLSSNSNFTGDVNVENGTLRIYSMTGGQLSNYLGALNEANSYTVHSSGVLIADDSAIVSNNPVVNLLSDTAPISLQGGQLEFISSNATGNSIVTETAGNVTLDFGLSTITTDRYGSANASGAVFALGSLTQTTYAATINFTNVDGTLGVAGNNPQITFATAPSLNNGIIGGWALVNTNDFASYDPTNGVGALSTSGFIGYSSTNLTSAGATDNVLVTNTPSAAITTRTVNSIKWNTTTATMTIASGATLTIDSGGLLAVGNVNKTITPASGTATLSANGGALYVHNNQATITINTVIADGDMSTALVKDQGGTLSLAGSTDNLYTGGTWVLGGGLTTGTTAGRTYLGTGPVTVDRALLTQGNTGATSSPLGYTVIEGGQVTLSTTSSAYTAAGDVYNISAGSAIAGAASAAGKGINSLSRVDSMTGGGQVVLAPGAVVANTVQLTSALNLSTGTIQNLGTASDLLYGIAATQNNANGNVSIGIGTPFFGVSTDRSSRAWDLGTITITPGTTDVVLQALDYSDSTGTTNTAATLTFGNGITANGPVINASNAVNVHIASGIIELNDNDATYGNSSTAPVTFVVDNGAILVGAQDSSLGSGTGVANVVVSNGGVLEQNPTNNVGTELNGNVEVQGGGEFLAQITNGLTGTGQLTFDPGSILQISNVSGWSGSQAAAANISDGAIVRLAVTGFGDPDAPLLSTYFDGKGIYEINNNVGAANPTDPNTVILALNGGIVTNDSASRTFSGAGNGIVTVGTLGATLAASSGTYMNWYNATDLGSNTLTIGSNSVIDGNAKLGEIRLEGTFSAAAGAQIDIIPNASLRVSVANILDDSIVVNLPLGAQLYMDQPDTITNVVGAGTLSGDSLLTLVQSGDYNLDAQLAGVNASFGIAQNGGGAMTITNPNITGFGSIVANNGTALIGPGIDLGGTYALSANALGAGVTATVDLNGTSQTVTALTFAGSTTTSAPIITGAGSTITLAGNVTYTSTNNPLGGLLNVATLDLGDVTRTFSVGDSTSAPVDLEIDSLVQSSGGLTKSGTGLLLLTNTGNDYTGQNWIQAGTLSVASIGNDGVQSMLGQQTGSLSPILLGSGSSTGALQYTGPGEVLTRSFDMMGTTGGGTIDSSGTGSLIINSDLLADGVGNKTFNLTGSYTGVNTFAGAIIDPGPTNSTSLSVSTSGTWVISGNDSYTGTTIVRSGTLQLQDAGSISDAATTVVDGTLDLNGISTQITSLSLGGTGAVSTSFPIVSIGTGGTLTLGGNVTYTNTSNPLGSQITGGMLDLGGATRTFNVGNSTGATVDLEVDSLVQGSGGITKTGAGSLELTNAANDYTGQTWVQAGTLIVTGFGNVGSAGVLGNQPDAGTATIKVGNTTTAVGLQYLGAGEMTDRVIDLSGTTGGASIDSSGTGALVFTSDFTASGNGNKTLTLTGTNTALNTVGGAIVDSSTGVTSLVKDGYGTWLLAGDNSYSGNTSIQSGILAIGGAADRLPTGTTVILGDGTTNDSGKLVLGDGTTAQNQTLAGLSTAGTGTDNRVVGGGPTVANLTVNLPGGFDEYDGFLGGSGTYENNLSLTVTGTGTLLLTAPETYTGGTTINGGGLVLSNTAQVQGNIVVNGGFVDLASPSNLTGDIVLGPGGVLPIDTDSVGNVSLLDPSSTGVVALNFNNSTLTNLNGTDTFLGAVGDRIFSSATFDADPDGNYRLGGGAPWDNMDTVTTGGGGGLLQIAAANVLTGANNVIIGDPNIAGGGSTVQLTAAQNYTGTTTLDYGSLIFSNVNEFGSPTTVAGSLILNGGILQYNTATTTDVSSRLAIADGGGINTNGNNVTFATAIGNTASGGTGGLAKLGLGTLTMSKANTYVGATTVAGGTLKLDFNASAAATTDILSNASSLVMSGGALSVNGKGSTNANSQTWTGTTFAEGASTLTTSFTAATNGAGGLTVDLGTLSRNQGATVNFGQGTNSNAANTTYAISSGPASSLLIDNNGTAYATYNLTDWAAVDATGSQVVSGASLSGFYTNASGTTLLSGNANIVGGNATLSDDDTISSLRMDDTAKRTLDLGGNTLVTGGVLFAGVTGNAITDGTLTGPSGSDLTVIANNTGDATISAAIGDNGGTGLTKAGTGRLFLTNTTSSYLGPTVIDAGILNVAGTISAGVNGALGNASADASNLIINGGTLQETESSVTRTFSRDFSVGLAGASIDSSMGSTSAWDFSANAPIGLIDSGARTLTLTGSNTFNNTFSLSIGDNGGPTSLEKAGAGLWDLTAINSYTGTTTIAQGILRINNAGALPGGLGALDSSNLNSTNTGGGNLDFAAIGSNTAILELTAASGSFYRSLGTGIDQVQWTGNGGFSAIGGDQVVNLGGDIVPDQVTWGSGSFVSNILDFGDGGNGAADSMINFQNPIDLGNKLRTINVDNGRDAIDAELTGTLTGTVGAGLTKSGAGALLLNAINDATTDSSSPITVNAGYLVFATSGAILGSGQNITVNAGGGVVLEGATDASLLMSRLVNTSAGSLSLDTSSSATIDFTNFANLSLGAFSNVGGTPIYFTGDIIPNSETYRLGSANSGSAVSGGGGPLNFNGNYLVLPNAQTLTDDGSTPRSLVEGAGYLLLQNWNDFSGGTTLTAAGTIGIGNDYALGSGTLTYGANVTIAIGSLDGDHTIANSIVETGTGSFIINGNLVNDGIPNAGGLTFLGSFDLNGQTGRAIYIRSPGNAIFLGDVTDGANLNLDVSTAGTYSFLTLPTDAVAKDINGIIQGLSSTLIIDSAGSLGTIPTTPTTVLTVNSSTLEVQPGTPAVALDPNQNISISANTSTIFNTPGGPLVGNSTLTIPGVIAGGGTGVFTKNGLGTLVLQGDNTFTAKSVLINGGTLQLDFSAANSPTSNILAAAFPVTLGAATGGGGGTLAITGADGAANSQAFGDLTIDGKENAINVAAGAGGTVTVTLGNTFTTTLGAVLQITSDAGSTIASGAGTPSQILLDAGGNAYATFNASDYAAENSTDSAIVAGSSIAGFYTPSTLTTLGGNADVVTNVALGASTSVTSLRFNDSSDDRTLTLGATLNTGGILVTPNVGVNASLITGGTLMGTGGSLKELDIMQNNPLGSLTIASVIADDTTATALVKAGVGDLVLSGVNTYTGVTYFNGGTIEVASMANGAAASPLGKASNAGGNWVFTGGALRYNAAGNATTDHGATFDNVSAIEVTQSTSTLTLSSTTSQLTGQAGVVGILQKTGDGTLVLGGTGSDTNLSVEVVAGTLDLGKNSNTAYAVSGGAGGAALIVDNGATAVVTGTGGQQVLTSSSVVVSTGGTFDFNGSTQTFDGLAGGGTVTNDNASNTGLIILGANNDANISQYSVAAANAGVATTGLNNFSGVIADGASPMGLIKIGAGTQILSGLNTYSQDTDIVSGTIQLGIADALPSGAGAGNVVITNNTVGGLLVPGTLDLSGFDQTVNGLSGSGGLVTNSALATTATLTVGATDATNTFDGTLQNGYTNAILALSKIGAGTLTLTENNLYTGITTINAGTLALAGAGSIGTSSAINVLAGAAFDVTGLTAPALNLGQTLEGTGTVYATDVGYTINGTLSPGDVATTGIGTLNVLGDLTLGSTAASNFKLGSGANDSVAVTGNLNLGGSLNLLDNAGANGQGSLGPGQYQLFTYTGTDSGAFASVSISTSATLHPNVVNDVVNHAVDVDIYRLASAASIANPGSANYHVGDVASQAITIQNTAAADGFSEKLDATFGPTSGATTNGGSVSLLAAGNSDSTSMLVGVDTSTPGAATGTVSINLASDGTGTSGYGSTSLDSQTVTVSGNVYAFAATNDLPTTINLGNIHVGESFGTQTISISNSGIGGVDYTEGLSAAVVTISGGASSNSASFSDLRVGDAANTSLVVGLGNADTNDAGNVTGTVTVALTSSGVIDGLGDTSLGTESITVLGSVYTGQGVWNTNGGGSWATFANWTGDGGAPGLDPNYTTGDAATFGNALGGGSALITLDGVSPSISTLTFDNATSSYTIAQGTGGTLHLNSITFAAVNVNAGSDTISAPLALDANTTFTINASTDALTLSGGVNGTGSLTMQGDGTLDLASTNSFTGGVTVASGLLNVFADQALGTGDVTVSNTGTLAFNNVGNYTGTNSLMIYGGSSTPALLFTGANSFGGNITVATLAGNTMSTIDFAAGSTTTLAGTLTKDGTTLHLYSDGADVTIAGTIAGLSAGSDVIFAGNTVTTSNYTLASPANYNGPTYITDGSTLFLGASNVLPGNSTYAANPRTDMTLTTSSSLGSVFNLNGFSDTIRSLAGDTNAVVTGTADSTLTISPTSAGSTVYNGAITGGMSLAFNGVAESGQILTGPETYAGSTTVYGGALLVNGSMSGGGVVTINSDSSGANPGIFGGTGMVSNAVVVSGGPSVADNAVISPGNAIPVLDIAGNTNGATGMLTVANYLTINGTYLWDLDVSNPDPTAGNYDQINLADNRLSLGSTSALDLNFLNGTGPTNDAFWDDSKHTWDIITGLNALADNGTLGMPGAFGNLLNGDYAGLGSFSVSYTNTDVLLTWNPAAVPEPGSLLLGALAAAAGLGGWRRRKSAASNDDEASQTA
jgi:autotransporter-associated beta strand protein